jgi:hypothetical protein
MNKATTDLLDIGYETVGLRIAHRFCFFTGGQTMFAAGEDWLRI